MLTEKALRRMIREESKKLQESTKAAAIRDMSAALEAYAGDSPYMDTNTSMNIGKTMIAAVEAGVTYEEALDILDASSVSDDDKAQFQELVSSTFS
jgi:hypothetical protein